jgi:hypothetical protein
VAVFVKVTVANETVVAVWLIYTVGVGAVSVFVVLPIQEHALEYAALLAHHVAYAGFEEAGS